MFFKDSDSITPPSSPLNNGQVLGIPECIDRPMSSSADQQQCKFVCDGFLFLKHHLTRYMELGSNWGHQNTKLHVNEFHIYTQSFIQKCREAFLMLRQEVIRLETKIETNDETRVQIQHFFMDLHYLLGCKAMLDFGEKESFIVCIMHEVKHLLTFLGSLADVYKEGQMDVYHVHLDVWWGCIETLHLVQDLYPSVLSEMTLIRTNEPADDQDSFFLQALKLFFWCTTEIVLDRYNKEYHADRTSITCWPCSCLKEMVILSFHLVKSSSTLSIWSIFNPILQSVSELQLNDPVPSNEIDSDVFILPPDIVCKERLSFTWWFFLELVKLQQYTINGSLSVKKVPQSNYSFLHKLLKKSLQQRPKPKELQLRLFLKCCLEISDVWIADVDTLTHLWDYFYRNMNDQFVVAGHGIASYSLSHAANNSMSMFLKLIDKSMMEMNSMHINRFKGRVFSKYHPRRMQEMSEVGLVHFNQIFLILAKYCNLEEVGKKLVELFTSGLQASYVEVGRRREEWTVLFRFVMLYQEKSLDCSVLVKRLVQEFHSVIRHFLQNGIESSTRHNLWGLIQFYLDRTMEVLEKTDNLSLGQPNLIDNCLVELLNGCRQNEIASVLDFAYWLIERVRSLYSACTSHQSKEKVKSLSDSTWKTFYGFVQSHSTSLTPNSRVSDVAVAFTLLAFESPLSAHVPSAKTIFGYFSGDIHHRVVCSYLVQLVPNPTLQTHLHLKSPEQEMSLIQIWLRCFWLTTGASDDLDQLSRFVSEMPTMKVFNLQPDSDTNLAIDYFKGLNRNYSIIQDFQSRIQYQSRTRSLLSDVPKWIGFALKSLHNEQLLLKTYFLAGNLVKHCSILLYVKSQPQCLLPVLLDKLVLPRSIFNPSKPAPPIILNAIKQHIHLFLLGISHLDWQKDAYISRKLRDMVDLIIKRYTPSTVSTSHPLVLSLSKSCMKESSDNASSFRHTVMKLTLSMASKQQAFSIFSVLLKKTQDPMQLTNDSKVLLVPILVNLLQNEQKQTSTIILQVLLERDICADTTEVLVPLLRDFISTNARLYGGQLFRVIENVAAIKPGICVKLIPSLTEAVYSIERKIGSGVDTQLRMQYFNVLKHCGEYGQEERSRLLRETTI